MADPLPFPRRSGMGTTRATMTKTKEGHMAVGETQFAPQCASNPVTFLKMKRDVLLTDPHYAMQYVRA